MSEQLARSSSEREARLLLFEWRSAGAVAASGPGRGDQCDHCRTTPPPVAGPLAGSTRAEGSPACARRRLDTPSDLSRHVAKRRLADTGTVGVVDRTRRPDRHGAHLAEARVARTRDMVRDAQERAVTVRLARSLVAGPGARGP
jgi:hypothetical protein